MAEPALLAVLLGIGTILGVVSWVATLYSKAAKYDTLKPELDRIDEHRAELAQMAAALKEREGQFSILVQEKTTGFPWLAKAYAQLIYLWELKEAKVLETKTRPALKAAEELRKHARERQRAEKKARILQFQIAYYETLFPWLVELKDEDIEDELIRVGTGDISPEESQDPSRRWLTAQEYAQLLPAEKFELALNRYWDSHSKTKWEIGRDYERYVGYRYEEQGYHVEYQGIAQGLADLGRDLIVSKGDEVGIVQCKCWSAHRTIHEKHIFQLHGTCVAHKIDNPQKQVRGIFVTSTTLSLRAREFAEHLGIQVREELQFKRYPCIKCNISRRTEEKIYHLPFDQQYDTTVVEPQRGEFYAKTIAEAEHRGFRRAYRHRAPH